MTNPTPHGQVPAIQRYKIGYHSDEWGVRSSTPGGIPDPSGQWVRYEDHAAALRRLHAYCQELESQVIRDCMTHVQNPAEIEHVAGDVSGNGAESNTAGAVLTDEDIEAIALEQIGFDGGLQAVNGMDLKRIVRAAERKIASRGQAPAGDWLWCKLMDFCKKRGFDPAKFNDLFEIVAAARAPAESVLEDAARWQAWAAGMVEACAAPHGVTPPFMAAFEEAIGDSEACFSVEQLNGWVDAARKQGANHD